MRIMTINVWGDYYENPVELREGGVFDVIENYKPDILGLQEMTVSWHDAEFMKWMKKDYTCIEIYYLNHEPIYYRTDKFELVECGWEDMEETPDISKHFTWVVLKERETDKKIGIVNTHFWWKIGDEHDRIRVVNAKQLLKIMQQIKKRYQIPVIAMGDLNCTVGSGAMNFLEEHQIYTVLKLMENPCKTPTLHGDPKKGADGKFHGKEAAEDAITIDHIVTFKDDVEIKKHDVVVYQEILDATDHSPVYIDIEY